MRLRKTRGNGGPPEPAVDTPAPAGEPVWLDDPGFGRSVLDSVSANVFVTDPELRVLYANPRALSTLGGLEATSGMRADQIVGTDLRPLHQDPDQLAGQMRDPAFRPTGGQFTIGGATLGAQINRVTDARGTCRGYAIAWADITRKIATDQRAQAETREVSAVLETVSSASEELAATANEIARNAVDASTTVAEAIASVEAANQTMVELGEASGRINEIVKTITAVADQTNLLALNATIEAARAGELGKGFAVVAGEVKELSKQTKSATERINEMIGQVQSLSTAAIDAIAEISGIVARVNDRQQAIADTVDQQTATTREISSNLAVAAERARHIADFVAGKR